MGAVVTLVSLCTRAGEPTGRRPSLCQRARQDTSPGAAGVVSVTAGWTAPACLSEEWALWAPLTGRGQEGIKPPGRLSQIAASAMPGSASNSE
jgi:hypothetical protein